MTDLEKELVEKLVEKLFAYRTYAALVREELLHIIHSHTQALVAAAYAACAEHLPPLPDATLVSCSCGAYFSSRAAWQAHIRSLTPADAARELERHEDALIREALQIGQWAPQRMALNYDVLIKKVRDRLPSLSKPAPERCPSQFLGAFCELPKGHLGNHRGDEGEWKDYFTERLSKPAPVERSNENG